MNLPADANGAAWPRWRDEWKTYWKDDGPRFVHIAKVAVAVALAMGLCMPSSCELESGAFETGPKCRPARHRQAAPSAQLNSFDLLFLNQLIFWRKNHEGKVGICFYRSVGI
ncbi:hypothetical protein WN982_35340 [Paraburkholderia sp. IMGN_8]|uniref:hypothetical protein n=1 Tax=Paraburkholderia sp. IMGN_8 TaxID=3136564 RepID=UPI003100BA29